ncbi:MAG TPA: hypothetical protein VLZ89_16165 [Anaerolineales bacterium]|nr:hypothetical protein [Anaerolineales bacterium]
MKTKMFVTIILIALVLTACGTTATASQSAAATSKSKSFSGQAELIVGLFKLEGTARAVTAQQAAQLLPLWEVMKVLAASDTAAQVEIDAAARQIRETLTPSQLQAITAMQLTEGDVAAFEQSLNTTTVQSSRQSSSSQSNQGSFAPDGGGPGADALDGILGGVSQLQNTTAAAASVQSASQTASSLPTALLDAVIKLLQTKGNT